MNFLGFDSFPLLMDFPPYLLPLEEILLVLALPHSQEFSQDPQPDLKENQQQQVRIHRLRSLNHKKIKSMNL